MGLKFTDRTSCNNCNWFNSKYRHSNFDTRSKVAFGRGLTERSDLKELGTSWLWRSFDLVFKVYKTTTLRTMTCVSANLILIKMITIQPKRSTWFRTPLATNFSQGWRFFEILRLLKNISEFTK